MDGVFKFQAHFKALNPTDNRIQGVEALELDPNTLIHLGTFHKLRFAALW